MSKKALKWLLAITVALAPLLLWADVWLAFQFGFWIDALVGGTDGMAGMLGCFAFFVLAVAEGLALWLVTEAVRA